MKERTKNYIFFVSMSVGVAAMLVCHWHTHLVWDMETVEDVPRTITKIDDLELVKFYTNDTDDLLLGFNDAKWLLEHQSEMTKFRGREMFFLGTRFWSKDCSYAFPYIWWSEDSSRWYMDITCSSWESIDDPHGDHYLASRSRAAPRR